MFVFNLFRVLKTLMLVTATHKRPKIVPSHVGKNTVFDETFFRAMHVLGSPLMSTANPFLLYLVSV